MRVGCRDEMLLCHCACRMLIVLSAAFAFIVDRGNAEQRLTLASSLDRIDDGDGSKELELQAAIPGEQINFTCTIEDPSSDGILHWYITPGNGAAPQEFTYTRGDGESKMAKNGFSASLSESEADGTFTMRSELEVQAASAYCPNGTLVECTDASGALKQNRTVLVASVPYPPGGLQVTNHTLFAITLGWDTPLFDGLSDIIAYDILWTHTDPHGQSSTMATTSTSKQFNVNLTAAGMMMENVFVVTGVDYHDSHNFSARAVNLVGPSEWTQPLLFTITPEDIEPPTDLVVSHECFLHNNSQFLHISWKNPSLAPLVPPVVSVLVNVTTDCYQSWDPSSPTTSPESLSSLSQELPPHVSSLDVQGPTLGVQYNITVSLRNIDQESYGNPSAEIYTNFLDDLEVRQSESQSAEVMCTSCSASNGKHQGLTISCLVELMECGKEPSNEEEEEEGPPPLVAIGLGKPASLAAEHHVHVSLLGDCGGSVPFRPETQYCLHAVMYDTQAHRTLGRALSARFTYDESQGHSSSITPTGGSSVQAESCYQGGVVAALAVSCAVLACFATAMFSVCFCCLYSWNTRKQQVHHQGRGQLQQNGCWNTQVGGGGEGGGGGGGGGGGKGDGQLDLELQECIDPYLISPTELSAARQKSSVKRASESSSSFSFKTPKAALFCAKPRPPTPPPIPPSLPHPEVARENIGLETNEAYSTLPLRTQVD